MDKFHEQLLKVEKSGKYKITSFLVYFFIVVGFLTLFVSFIITGISFVLAIAMFFLKKKFFVEYEYAFTNGDIDIDKIIEMKKRKRVISFNIKDAEILAPEDSCYIRDFCSKPQNIMNCYPDSCEKNVYTAMITGGNNRVQLNFMPDDELLELCYMYNPRAVKKN